METAARAAVNGGLLKLLAEAFGFPIRPEVTPGQYRGEGTAVRADGQEAVPERGNPDSVDRAAIAGKRFIDRPLDDRFEAGGGGLNPPIRSHRP